MELEFRRATPSDAASISRLVQESFLEFVAPEWETHAVARFLHDSSPAELASFIGMADFSAIACAGNEPVGFIHLARANLLKALFVNKSWHKRGIARRLWSLTLEHLMANHPKVNNVELNASSFAVDAYKTLGFHPIAEPQLQHGCLSTRMACPLPACHIV